MGSFVNPNDKVEIEEFDPSVVISDVTPRIITIRAKMTYAIQKHVQGYAVKMSADKKETEFDLGDSLMELLVCNVLAWRGGDFEGVPCTPANIRTLDPTDPFIDRVADEIGVRNKKKESPNPKSTDHDGSTSDGSIDLNTQAEKPNLQSANGMRKSPLLTALAGTTIRSED